MNYTKFVKQDDGTFTNGHIVVNGDGIIKAGNRIKQKNPKNTLINDLHVQACINQLKNLACTKSKTINSASRGSSHLSNLFYVFTGYSISIGEIIISMVEYGYEYKVSGKGAKFNIPMIELDNLTKRAIDLKKPLPEGD